MSQERLQEVVRIINDGGATYQEIAGKLDITPSTARDHVGNLIDEGEAIVSVPTENGQKEFYYSQDVGLHPTNNQPSNQEAVLNKRKKTRQIRDHLHDMEARLERLLNESEPAVAEGYIEPAGDQDVVIHRTDAHFGDEIRDEFGQVEFDTDIVERREREVLDKALGEVQRQQQLGIDFGTTNLLMGGDMVTGEVTYPHQQSEIVDNIDEQLDRAFELYMEYIQRLSSMFPKVKVVCQSGNHGEIDPSYSNGANFDRILYMMLDKAIRASDMENITFIQNRSSVFTNFRLRNDLQEDMERAEALGLDAVSELSEDHRTGWKFHLRHGDNSLEHIGTSAGKRRWYNWLGKHEFDQAYRGHYHKHSVDTVMGDVRCIMSGSPKPSDDFEEQIAEWSTPSAYVHGVSDEETVTWARPISFDN